jgi:hypothetical protein
VKKRTASRIQYSDADSTGQKNSLRRAAEILALIRRNCSSLRILVKRRILLTRLKRYANLFASFILRNLACRIK